MIDVKQLSKPLTANVDQTDKNNNNDDQQSTTASTLTTLNHKHWPHSTQCFGCFVMKRDPKSQVYYQYETGNNCTRNGQHSGQNSGQNDHNHETRQNCIPPPQTIYPHINDQFYSPIIYLTRIYLQHEDEKFKRGRGRQQRHQHRDQGGDNNNNRNPHEVGNNNNQHPLALDIINRINEFQLPPPQPDLIQPNHVVPQPHIQLQEGVGINQTNHRENNNNNINDNDDCNNIILHELITILDWACDELLYYTSIDHIEKVWGQ